ncbi:MAG: NifB/NifX family molybdenum-iron cluster-binding protein [Candidatus Omnitrophica bacterium]|nr:NifB/NifX family molybdenum-iron cluster-binding protein [Candidatus Omnitrophota bacterium]
MKIGITINDQKGMDSDVSLHFGQCKYFLIVEIKGSKITDTKVFANTAVHGGGGCTAVDEILKYGVSHVIAGGMGMGAQQKFIKAGVKVSGFEGKVKDAVKGFIENSLHGLGSCKDHGECH